MGKRETFVVGGDLPTPPVSVEPPSKAPDEFVVSVADILELEQAVGLADVADVDAKAKKKR